ncbi:MAG: hypothetical protein C5B51_26370 [Terriglobia bacterium]|nr:MAG: hypothetical protein C5B51_26370 [Terriglobia bacterium]
MGVCEYCGEKAGWFQSNHLACVDKAHRTGDSARALVTSEILAGKTLGDLQTAVEQLLVDSKIKEAFVRDTLQQAVNEGITQAALRSPLSVDEKARLEAILSGYEVHSSPNRQWYGPAFVEMSHILWLVFNDLQFGVDFSPAFNLHADEFPVFQTGNCVTYAEERTVSNHSRSFSGLSIPVGGGIYYHVGGSQEHQERTTGLMPLDGGMILITSQALYFAGQQRTLRIPLEHVLRYQPYVDAVGVCESHGAPKVFVFDYRGMNTGWFFYNLLSDLTSKRNSAN